MKFRLMISLSNSVFLMGRRLRSVSGSAGGVWVSRTTTTIFDTTTSAAHSLVSALRCTTQHVLCSEKKYRVIHLGSR